MVINNVCLYMFKALSKRGKYTVFNLRARLRARAIHNTKKLNISLLISDVTLYIYNCIWLCETVSITLQKEFNRYAVDGKTLNL